jgi:hypothetical protein
MVHDLHEVEWFFEVDITGASLLLFGAERKATAREPAIIARRLFSPKTGADEWRHVAHYGYMPHC